MLFIISYHSYFSPSRLLDFYLPFDKNTNKETESISYFPLSIISIFFSFLPFSIRKANTFQSRIFPDTECDRRYRNIRWNPDLFWKYSFLFSRREKERERDATLFGKGARVSTCFETLRMLTRRWLRFSTERANRKVGRGEGARGGRQVHFSLARCNVYILRLQPTLVTFYAPVTLPSLSTYHIGKAAAPLKRISLFYSNGVSECSLT